LQPAGTSGFQYNPVWLIVVVLTFIAGIGAFAERIFGHGPPLLLGFCLGGLMLWRDRRREPPRPPEMSRQGGSGFERPGARSA
jgi:hypothetical protein